MKVMKQRLQEGDSEVFDLAWLDQEELAALQRGMLANSDNEICEYWLRSLNEQAAIRARRLRIVPGSECKELDFSQYSISDLDAAQLIFGCMRGQFNASGKSTGERFCKLIVEYCGAAISTSKSLHSRDR